MITTEEFREKFQPINIMALAPDEIKAIDELMQDYSYYVNDWIIKENPKKL